MYVCVLKKKKEKKDSTTTSTTELLFGSLTNRIKQNIVKHSLKCFLVTNDDDNWCLRYVWMGEWMKITFVYLWQVCMFVGLCHNILYIFYKQKKCRKVIKCMHENTPWLLFCILTIQFMLGFTRKPLNQKFLSTCRKTTHGHEPLNYIWQ